MSFSPIGDELEKELAQSDGGVGNSNDEPAPAPAPGSYRAVLCARG